MRHAASVCMRTLLDRRVDPATASRALIGRHDFASLLTRPSMRVTTERTVFAADWLEVSPDLVLFEICADAYLKQMVRTIVGSLMWVGNGRWTILPSTMTPIVMYWPASKGVGSPSKRTQKYASESASSSRRTRRALYTGAAGSMTRGWVVTTSVMRGWYRAVRASRPS